MKKILSLLIAIGILSIGYYFRNDIIDFFVKSLSYNEEVIIPTETEYKLDYSYLYVKDTNNFYIKNKQDLLNAFFTIINSGWNDFYFFCDESFRNCPTEVVSFSKNSELLSIINNFVHPFNSYKRISISINDYGKITVNIEKLYNDGEIEKIEKEINEIYEKIIKEEMTDKEKVRVIHDYIINNTSYDKKASLFLQDNKELPDNSSAHKANGVLFDKVAICSGYSDAMALFLNKIGLPNYKISSSSHIWNLVYIDGEWFHLDVTFDDPYAENGKNYLLDTLFLITTDRLKEQKTNQHEFNEKIFIEAS